jgi:hypothetical protein
VGRRARHAGCVQRRLTRERTFFAEGARDLLIGAPFETAAASSCARLLGQRLRVQSAHHHLNSRLLQDGSDDRLTRKPPIAGDSSWPRAGAPSIDFFATLLTAGLPLGRLLCSRQIEQSSDRTHSEAGAPLRSAKVG